MISTHSPNEWDRVSEAILLGLSVDFMACVPGGGHASSALQAAAAAVAQRFVCLGQL